MNRLQGKIAVITGALSGIGLASARRMHAEGASVILSDLAPADSAQVAAVLAGFGERARYLRLDAMEEQDWNAARDSIAAREARLDILVHNAGAAAPGLLETLSLDAWRRVQAVNTDGLFLGTRAMIDLLAHSGEGQQGGSSIVIISSMLGMVGFVNSSAYVTSKGAARLFTKAAAVEFAGRGLPVRVNSIHPGFVATPMTLSGLEKIAAENGMPSTDMLVEQLNSKTPMRRMGTPEEIASAVAFLASPDAAFMTGSEMMVDGGYTAQ